jgi:hypothetical protein
MSGTRLKDVSLCVWESGSVAGVGVEVSSAAWRRKDSIILISDGVSCGGRSSVSMGSKGSSAVEGNSGSKEASERRETTASPSDGRVVAVVGRAFCQAVFRSEDEGEGSIFEKGVEKGEGVLLALPLPFPVSVSVSVEGKRSMLLCTWLSSYVR